MAKEVGDLAEIIENIRTLLADVLDGRVEPRQPVAEILRLLHALERAVRPSMPFPKTRPYKDAKHYRVDVTNRGEVLVEFKPGRSTASGSYRCPKPVYDSLALVLAENENPQEFEELMDAIHLRMKDDPGGYQARVALRYWMETSPPVVTRVRSKYRAIERASFRAVAEGLWKKAVGRKRR